MTAVCDIVLVIGVAVVVLLAVGAVLSLWMANAQPTPRTRSPRSLP